MIRRRAHEKALDDLRRAHAREREEWLRERRDLLDRIMYMADRPWTLPETPAVESPQEEPEVTIDYHIDEVV